ncbi:hypothetical protein ACHAQH_005358 [Verticillium albo-atrum]
MSTSEDIESLPAATASATTGAPEPEPTTTPPVSVQQASTEFEGWSIGPSENWQAHTIYRNLAPVLPSTTDQSTTEQSTSDSSATTATASSASASPTDGSDSSDNSDGGSSTPVGAIAGGVVGGIALIGILVFALWFLRRRSARRDAAKEAQAAGSYSGNGNGYGGYGVAPGSEFPSESAAAMSQSDRHTWTQSPYQGGSEPHPSPGYPMPHGHQPVPQQPPATELGHWQGHGNGQGGEAMELDGSYASEAGRQRPLSELPVIGHYGPAGSGYGR